MTTLIIAKGLCSAIRYDVLTAFPPKRYPSIKVSAWGLGHWHMPVPDNMHMPDDDPWVKQHVCHVEVDGDLSFAIWAEYVLCRLIQTQKDQWMYLMHMPLEPRNEQWAAQWDTLPDGWRNRGCKEWDQLQAERVAQQLAVVRAAALKGGQQAQRPQQQRSAGGSVLGRMGRIFKDPLDW